MIKDEVRIENICAVNMKLQETCLSFILEDFAVIGLQFFYFEKYYFMGNDVFVYFNAFFMVVKALEFAVRIIIVSIENCMDEDRFQFNFTQSYFENSFLFEKKIETHIGLPRVPPSRFNCLFCCCHRKRIFD